MSVQKGERIGFKFALPCSVSGGVNVEKFLQLSTKYGERVEKDTLAYIKTLDLKDVVPALEKCESVSDVNENPDLITEIKRALGTTVEKDRTDMKTDLDLYSTSLALDGWSTPMGPNESGFPTDIAETSLAPLSGFLKCPTAEVTPVVLLGHGISQDAASALHNATIGENFVWKPSMENSIHALPNLKWYNAHVVVSSTDPTVDVVDKLECANTLRRNASVGDLCGFHHGLYSPSWVLEHIRNSEKASSSTYIFIVDSCYSGAWVNFFSGQDTNDLKIVIQTACSHTEQSYGGYFAPVFKYLQDMTEQELSEEIETFKKNRSDDSEYKAQHDITQTPQVWISDAASDNSDGPVVKIGGIRLFCSEHFFHYLFNLLEDRGDGYFDRAFGASRGVPESEERGLVQALDSGKAVIKTVKVKKIKGKRFNGTPLLLVHIQWTDKWKDKTKTVHFHYDGDEGTWPGKFTRVNTFSTKGVTPSSKRKEVRESNSTSNISLRDWEGIKQKIEDTASNILQQNTLDFKDKGHWNMNSTDYYIGSSDIPQIRSRTHAADVAKICTP